MFSLYFVDTDLNDSQAKWILTDIADKTQRGTSKRMREKIAKLSQLAHTIVRNKEESEMRSKEAEDRAQDLERRLEEREYQDGIIEGERHWLVQRK